MSDPYFPSLKDIMTAEHTLNDILVPTPLMKNRNLSDKYEANIFLKREDLQMVRSYKIRGAYNKIKSLTPEEMEKGVVCASAGNHAQGVAFSCSKLGIQGKIYMPVTTPRQKINQVKMFGGKSIEVVLTGDTFDQANTAAIEACKKNDMVFIPPFNDPRIIEGQATVGLEIIQEARMKLDYIFVPIGGGGLATGVSTLAKLLNPKIKVIGVEPAGANCMQASFAAGKVTTLPTVSTIADGTAVKTPGSKIFPYIRQNLDDIITVEDDELVAAFLDMVENHKMIVENSGLLTVAALKHLDVSDKRIVSILSGGNMDVITMSSVVQQGLILRDRIFTVSVLLPDKPGELCKVSGIIAAQQGNVIKLEHNQFVTTNRSAAVELRITLECFGTDHKKQIIKALEKKLRILTNSLKLRRLNLIRLMTILRILR